MRPLVACESDGDRTPSGGMRADGRAAGLGAVAQSRFQSAYGFIEMNFHQFSVAICRLCYEKMCFAEEGAERCNAYDAPARRAGALPRAAPTEHEFISRVDEFLVGFLGRYAPILRKTAPRGSGLPRHATLALNRAPPGKRGETWRSNVLVHATARPEARARAFGQRRAQRIERFTIVGRATRAAEALGVPAEALGAPAMSHRVAKAAPIMRRGV